MSVSHQTLTNTSSLTRGRSAKKLYASNCFSEPRRRETAIQILVYRVQICALNHKRDREPFVDCCISSYGISINDPPETPAHVFHLAMRQHYSSKLWWQFQTLNLVAPPRPPSAKAVQLVLLKSQLYRSAIDIEKSSLPFNKVPLDSSAVLDRVRPIRWIEIRLHGEDISRQ